MKKTGTTEEALLTNHKPETHVRRRPSESTMWLHRSLYTAFKSCLSLVDFLSSLCATGTQRNRELAEASVVKYNCAFIHLCTFPNRRHP
uniref:Glycolipid transfer protein domain-containing protein n=1 Tax=Mesocestoides corti TaxID=53468 RepID=A0A5K3FJC2_MESCO